MAYLLRVYVEVFVHEKKHLFTTIAYHVIDGCFWIIKQTNYK